MSDTSNAPAPEGLKRRMIRSIPVSFFREGDVTKPDGTKKPRDLRFDVLKAADEGAGPVVCGVVIGRATGFKVKSNKQADGVVTESYMLEGRFEATRASDGASIRAPGLYVPPVFAETVVAELKGGAEVMSFGIEIAAIADVRPGASQAYQWIVSDLNTAVETDPLDAIKARMVKHPLIPGSGQPMPKTLSGPAPVHDKAGVIPMGDGSAPDAARAEEAATKRRGRAG